MFSLSTIIITSLISLVVGGIIGFLVSNSANKKQPISTEDNLANAEENLQNYQREVAEHFAQTATLVNTLTESYRDMHEHLASSALKLSTAEISRNLLSANNLPPGTVNINLQDAEIQAPRDWAPKKQGQEGTLSEGYGLDDSALEPSDQTTPEVDEAIDTPKV